MKKQKKLDFTNETIENLKILQKVRGGDEAVVDPDPPAESLHYNKIKWT